MKIYDGADDAIFQLRHRLKHQREMLDLAGLSETQRTDFLTFYADTWKEAVSRAYSQGERDGEDQADATEGGPRASFYFEKRIHEGKRVLAITAGPSDPVVVSVPFPYGFFPWKPPSKTLQYKIALMCYVFQKFYDLGWEAGASR